MAHERNPLDDEIEELLDLAREHLGMDVAFIGRFESGRRHFAVVSAATDADRALLEGASDPLETSYCGMIADGRLDAATPSTADHPVLRTMEVTEALDIRCYLGMPIYNDDGTVYGTVCAYAHAPHDGVSDEHASLLGFVAEVVSRRIASARTGAGDRDRARRHVEMLLRAGEPSIVLQPIVSLATGDVVSLEALARFSTGGPFEVFNQAHLAGLGVELELQAARNAIALVELLRSDLTVAVNVGYRTLMSDEFLALIEETNPRRVTWELTEHEQETDHATLADRLATMRAAGFTVGLDDVGSGYSGLERILRLEPEVIKLDRSLVTGVDTDPARSALVAATQGFAAKVGARLVAEGIENERERKVLTDLGIQYGQGFGLGRPVPIGHLPRAVRRPLAAA